MFCRHAIMVSALCLSYQVQQTCKGVRLAARVVVGMWPRVNGYIFLSFNVQLQ